MELNEKEVSKEDFDRNMAVLVKKGLVERKGDKYRITDLGRKDVEQRKIREEKECQLFFLEALSKGSITNKEFVKILKEAGEKFSGGMAIDILYGLVNDGYIDCPTDFKKRAKEFKQKQRERRN